MNDRESDLLTRINGLVPRLGIAVLFSILILSVWVGAVQADDLRNVRQNRILYVGVASNFSPFAYPGMDGELQGIDIALIDRIGDALEVEVEVIELAYAGVIDSLRLAQVDMIAGAIPMDDELDSIVDFSLAYYQADFGFMRLKSDSAPTMIQLSDLNWLNIGVQRGSVQAQYVQSYWIGAGLVPPHQVKIYDSREEAVEALNWNEIDVYLTTAPIYKRRFELSGTYEFLSEAWMKPRFAFACREGSTLIPEINRILTVLSQDGSAQQIADMALVEAQNVALPQDFTRAVPLSEIVKRSDCTYGLRFLGDETLADGEVVAAGSVLEKRWRVLNIGSCAWEAGTVLVPVTEPLVFPVVALPETKPGEVAVISMTFTAPETKGTYTGFFRLSAADGLDFGQILRLRLTIQ